MTAPPHVLAAVRSIPHPRREPPMTMPTPDPTDANLAKAVDLDRLEEALAVATPGPWRHAWFDVVEAVTDHAVICKPIAGADAAAIVAAVNAAPQMAAELRAIRAERDTLRAKQDAVQALAVRMRAQGEPYLNEFDRGLAAGYRDAADQIDRALDGS